MNNNHLHQTITKLTVAVVEAEKQRDVSRNLFDGLTKENDKLIAERDTLRAELEVTRKQRDDLKQTIESRAEMHSKLFKSAIKQRDKATAKLTALRNAADGQQTALNRAFWVAESQAEHEEERGAEFWQAEAGKIGAAMQAASALISEGAGS